MPTTTQVPSHTSYPPDEIIALSLKHPELVSLNRRLPHWPDEVKKAYPQYVAGSFMFPPFAQFLSQLNVGASILVCYQNSEGGIMTLTGMIKEVAWTGKGDDTQKGDHASIWFENNHRHSGEPISLWGNSIFAVGKIGPNAPTESGHDPNGSHFVELFG